MTFLSKQNFAIASISAVLLAGCSGSVEHRSGPQPLHPGDVVRAANGQSVPAPVQVPTIRTPAPQTVAPPQTNAAPAGAVAAVAAFCEPYVNNLNGAVAAIQAAGFKPVQNIKGPLGDVGTVYVKGGTNYALWTQKFARNAAPYTCGIDAPDTPALRSAIDAHMSAKAGAKFLGKNFGGIGLDKTWSVGNTLYIAGKSATPTFGRGKTYSFGFAKR